jgi:hypothetical protein
MTIYRYGGIAWIWRSLGGVALAGGVLLVVLAIRFADWTFVAMAAPLLVPVFALGWMVATRVDAEDDHIRVWTLGFARRRIARSALGRPHLRLTAGGTFEQIPAPRIWVPVRGGLPVYFDLLAEIPDLGTFERVVPLSPAVRRAISDD